MNLPEEPPSTISPEAIIGTGITLGALGVLFLLLGWAQSMREVYQAMGILLPIGAVLFVVGLIAAVVGHSRKRR